VGTALSISPSVRSLIRPFIVMDVMRSAAQREGAGRGVLHLEVGQPSSGAPAPVLAAAQRALATERLGYTLALGDEGLRRRISRHYAEAYGLSVAMENVVVTSGASGAFVLAFLAAFDPGERVAVACPGYPCYRNILKAIDVEPVEVVTSAATRFLPTPELLDRIPGPLAGLVVASPGNPTGTMLDEAEMKALATYCEGRGVRLISDEIYHGITYDGRRAVSAFAFSPNAVVVNSFSKYYSMTGWRLGWMLVPDPLVRRVEALAQNLYIAAPTLSQLAAVAAFDSREELDGHVARYARNRGILVDALCDMGIREMASPEGAFYVYADVAHLTTDSPTFCKRLLEATGVAITPGVDFDPARGRRTIRFSYSRGPDEVTEAVARFRDWVARP
jgi:aspartate/methionine/tyrosine aminotransferase